MYDWFPLQYLAIILQYIMGMVVMLIHFLLFLCLYDILPFVCVLLTSYYVSLVFDTFKYTGVNVWLPLLLKLYVLSCWLTAVGIIFLGVWSNNLHKYHSINCICYYIILHFSFRKLDRLIRLYYPPISGVYQVFLNSSYGPFMNLIQLYQVLLCVKPYLLRSLDHYVLLCSST